MSGSEGVSREELLALIADLRAADAVKDARIDALLVRVGELTAQVQALVLRLGKDSQNSSKPSVVGRAGPASAGWVFPEGLGP